MWQDVHTHFEEQTMFLDLRGMPQFVSSIFDLASCVRQLLLRFHVHSCRLCLVSTLFLLLFILYDLLYVLQ